MKTNLNIVAIALLSVSLLGADNQGMDKEFSSLAEQLAAQIKESGRKKLTVLDFTDLQGNGNELGRFVAEQLAVSLLAHRKDFSLMDRANLKTILAQHKLTAEGLVDPENAKKLGQFAGVDAIILGNTTPLTDTVIITATVIATDTAEIVSKVSRPLTKTTDINQLLSQQLRSNESSNKVATAGQQPTNAPRLEVDKNSQQVGDLLVKVESLRPGRTADGRSVLLATLFLVNTNAATPIAVALNDLSRPSLVNRRGDSLTPMSLTGLAYTDGYGRGGSSNFTEIAPGKSVIASITFYGPEATYGYSLPGSPATQGGVRNDSPYRLQAEIFVGNADDGRLPNVKKHNLMIDVENTK